MARKQCEHINPPLSKRGQCAICKRARERVYYKETYRSKKIDMVMDYALRHPDRHKTPEALAYFRKWSKMDRKRNPEKHHKYEVVRWQRHRDKLRAARKIWVEKNRAYVNAKEQGRRHNLRDQIGITQAEWEAIIAKQRGRCAECGNKEKLTQDHLDPKSKGGAHAPYNIRGLCGPCNYRKGSHIRPGTQMGLLLCKAGAA
ncbi:MAG: HNH endonuclease [Candidatus Aquilonibacter sp.]|jgi:5-methylcytosine-specific restriction endonuclease McrA